MFDKDCKLRKYKSVDDIIEDFYEVRLQMYSKRKKHLIKDLSNKLVKLSNRAKYIQKNLDGTIDLRRKKSDEVNVLLTGMSFALIDGDFKYLIKMPMDSVTQENVDKIMKEKSDAESELDILQKTSLEKMWLSELDVLKKEYLKYKTLRETIQKGGGKSTIKKRVIKKK